MLRHGFPNKKLSLGQNLKEGLCLLFVLLYFLKRFVLIVDWPSQVPSGIDSILLLRTIVSKVTLVSSIVGLPVVSVRAALARVRGRLGGQLSASGVAAGTRRLRTERFAPPTGVLLLLLLLLDIDKKWSVSLSTSTNHITTPQLIQPSTTMIHDQLASSSCDLFFWAIL